MDGLNQLSLFFLTQPELDINHSFLKIHLESIPYIMHILFLYEINEL